MDVNYSINSYLIYRTVLKEMMKLGVKPVNQELENVL
jgi:hypothetical protein